MHDATNGLEMDAFGSAHDLQPSSEFLLLREAHHRLMNSFTLMAVYLRRESGAASGTLPSKAVLRFEEMIYAQSELHRCLALGQTSDLIRIDDYMIRLCRCLSDALLRPFGVNCEVAADVGSLPAWQCERLGLATTELVMNAVKHAFRGRSGGKLAVKLRCRGDTWRCIVADNGSCLASSAENGVSAPRTRSIGLQIIESLVNTLSGSKTTHSTPAGTMVVITFPAFSV